MDLSKVKAARYWRLELTGCTPGQNLNLPELRDIRLIRCDVEEVAAYEPSSDELSADKTAVIMAALHRPKASQEWTVTAIGDACLGNATDYTKLRDALTKLSIDGCVKFKRTRREAVVADVEGAGDEDEEYGDDGEEGQEGGEGWETGEDS